LAAGCGASPELGEPVLTEGRRRSFRCRGWDLSELKRERGSLYLDDITMVKGVPQI